MGFFSKLFSSTEVARDVVDATISTGDKLFYTDEEKADNKKEMIKFFPTLLEAYKPFKLAQRYLALIFTFIFSFAFLSGLFMTFYNVYARFTEGKDAKLLEVSQVADLVSVFSLDYIMLAIVSFYFLGGSIESFKRTKG